MIHRTPVFFSLALLFILFAGVQKSQAQADIFEDEDADIEKAKEELDEALDEMISASKLTKELLDNLSEAEDMQAALQEVLDANAAQEDAMEKAKEASEKLQDAYRARRLAERNWLRGRLQDLRLGDLFIIHFLELSLILIGFAVISVLIVKRS